MHPEVLKKNIKYGLLVLSFAVALPGVIYATANDDSARPPGKEWKKTGTLIEEGKNLVLETSDGRYVVQFERPSSERPVNFDAISRRFFIGKKVRVSGWGAAADKTLIISSIVPSGLYSSTFVWNTPPAEGFSKQESDELIKYAISSIPTNQISKAQNAFRLTLMSSAGSAVKPGDQALLISVSGRMGGSVDGTNGHLAVGVATVGEDLSLDGAFYNIYPAGPGVATVGKVPLLDYVGHVRAGHANERPVYMAIIYGLSPEKIRQLDQLMKDLFDGPLLKEKTFGLSFNCTTMSLSMLHQIGVHGRELNATWWHKHGPGSYLRANPMFKTRSRTSTTGKVLHDLNYFFGNEYSAFVPRNAFESILMNLDYLNNVEHLGIHRVDYVFHAQIPSALPRGGTSVNGIVDYFVAPMDLDWID